MKLSQLRISNFQAFGPSPTTIALSDLTFFIGANGAGKTAALNAVCRMFSFDSGRRRILKSDFHVPMSELTKVDTLAERSLWIEADFEFSELKDSAADLWTIPTNFAHMRLKEFAITPTVRFRLFATIDSDGEIEETFEYVLEVDEEDQPKRTSKVQKADRNTIQVHYIPASRDPSEHVSYATNSLLGRTVRAIRWTDQQKSVSDLTKEISGELSNHPAIKDLSSELTSHWAGLHTGQFYRSPEVSFLKSEMDSLLRHLSVCFSPGHEEVTVSFERLSDGQKSLLYLSLVLAAHAIGKKALSNQNDSFVLEKLKPPIFTLIAMEEPENSLSPHFLGRIVNALAEFSKSIGSQGIIATHGPSLLKRVEPEDIRFFRLNADRESSVRSIKMPTRKDEAYKFVREAVQAFPELYFSRLVILCEGDSEEIVLPRLLKAEGHDLDLASISVVPLGGRHVNHFWRLLHGLDIPYLTLLDLDLGRHGGGWGRVRYVVKQLLEFPPKSPTLKTSHLDGIPKWNSSERLLETQSGADWIKYLESVGVYFSSPMDLDFAMLRSFSKAYGVEDADLISPSNELVTVVLGEQKNDIGQYSTEEQQYFVPYSTLFKNNSKPASHLQGLANLTDGRLVSKMPAAIALLITAATKLLGSLPE